MRLESGIQPGRVNRQLRVRRFPCIPAAQRRLISENSKANRIETMKGPAESGEICSVEVEK
jgi:hypothetical protein